MADDEEFIDTPEAFADEADEHDEDEEVVEMQMHTGERDVTPYSEEGRAELEEDDEAKPGELGYAKGATGGRKHGKESAKPLSKERYKPKRR
jgi:hypothetical protein